MQSAGEVLGVGAFVWWVQLWRRVRIQAQGLHMHRRLSRRRGQKTGHRHRHRFHLMDSFVLEAVLHRLRLHIELSSVLHCVGHLERKSRYKHLDPSILHLDLFS